VATLSSQSILAPEVGGWKFHVFQLGLPSGAEGILPVRAQVAIDALLAINASILPKPGTWPALPNAVVDRTNGWRIKSSKDTLGKIKVRGIFAVAREDGGDFHIGRRVVQAQIITVAAQGSVTPILFRFEHARLTAFSESRRWSNIATKPRHHGAFQR